MLCNAMSCSFSHVNNLIEHNMFRYEDLISAQQYKQSDVRGVL